jgi:hypothetical protein
MKTTNQELISKALGLTDLGYSQMVFDYATEWMKRYFFGNDIMIKALESSPLFWAWWKNQWNIRDEHFIDLCSLTGELLEGKVLEAAFSIYQDEHNVYGLIIFPNKLVRIEAGREIIRQSETIKKLK